MADRFEAHSRTFSLLTLVSRITGLARDAVFSRLFGAGLLMDAFFFAFLVPNLFRRLFGEGAIAAAFVPVYARLDRDDPAVARRLAGLTIGAVVALLGALTLAGETVLWFASRGGEPQYFTMRLMMIMLPYMPLVCLVAILGAALQVHGRFGPGAAAPVLLNLFVIGAAGGTALLWPDIDGRRHVTVIAGSVVVAGVAQVAWMARALGRHAPRDVDELRPLRGNPKVTEAVRTVGRTAAPMIIGLGVLQLNTFLDGLIASYPTTVGPTILGVEYPLSKGALAAINFAQRLYQFPLGVFGLAVATAIFPALARAHGDHGAFADLVARGLRLVVFIGLPASAGLALVATNLTRVILEGGAFDAGDSQRVAFILVGYAMGVWAYSMIHVLTRAYYASGDATTPVRLAVGMVALNLALNCTLIWTRLAEAGLAWSTSICATVQAGLLLAILRRRIPEILHDVGRSWLWSAALTGLMAAAVWLTRAALPDPSTWTGALISLAAEVTAGLVAVGAGAAALKRPELWWALGVGRERPRANAR